MPDVEVTVGATTALNKKFYVNPAAVGRVRLGNF